LFELYISGEVRVRVKKKTNQKALSLSSECFPAATRAGVCAQGGWEGSAASVGCGGCWGRVRRPWPSLQSCCVAGGRGGGAGVWPLPRLLRGTDSSVSGGFGVPRPPDCLGCVWSTVCLDGRGRSLEANFSMPLFV